MVYRFIADDACGFDDEAVDGCVMAGVGEADEDGFSLDFMCDFGEPDASDVALGFDTHCLVTPGQGTAYGCVREVTLADGVLRVVLDPASLADLDLDDPVVEAELRAPEEDVARFREVLSRVLAFGRPEARPVVTGL
ncbi:hypothetical protein O4J56_21140 [Nocardiopsis sp. RSe5-2]|uniref:Immunity protein 10 of polymorphic toxin system n=1 Tax=Nocardiopsis endophytica TaxID=3018445 RepID=A0ABT4U884_9ACTN|nr:Imm10 family immunity protein [Nocardiopsis endophytica]MDA2813165.1 hypothetical protein [Nocardiopsis endophytica]